MNDSRALRHSNRRIVCHEKSGLRTQKHWQICLDLKSTILKEDTSTFLNGRWNEPVFLPEIIVNFWCAQLNFYLYRHILSTAQTFERTGDGFHQLAKRLATMPSDIGWMKDIRMYDHSSRQTDLRHWTSASVTRWSFSRLGMPRSETGDMIPKLICGELQQWIEDRNT